MEFRSILQFVGRERGVCTAQEAARALLAFAHDVGRGALQLRRINDDAPRCEAEAAL